MASHDTHSGCLQKKASSTASQGHPQVGVVIPVFGNKETLEELHRRLCQVLRTLEFSFEIVFVDDACPKGSLAVLKELAELDPTVKAVALARNVGQNRAVLCGLRHTGASRVVVLDADLQDPPEAIADLLAGLNQGVAAIFGGKSGQYESTVRLLGSRLFKEVLHALCGMPRGAGIFVAMRREMVERVLALPAQRPYLPAMIACSGLPVALRPVNRARRLVGRSGYSFWKRLKTGWAAVNWVVLWKLGFIRPATSPNEELLPVRARLGKLFENVCE